MSIGLALVGRPAWARVGEYVTHPLPTRPRSVPAAAAAPGRRPREASAQGECGAMAGPRIARQGLAFQLPSASLRGRGGRGRAEA